MKKKLFDYVKVLLTENPLFRDSDKLLVWHIWQAKGLTNEFRHEEGTRTYITKINFMRAPSLESIQRARRKVQELNPELRSTAGVQRQKNAKAQTKGTFIFREKI